MTMPETAVVRSTVRPASKIPTPTISAIDSTLPLDTNKLLLPTTPEPFLAQKESPTKGRGTVRGLNAILARVQRP